MVFGRSRCATKRASGLSMPMPNAIVATITTPYSLMKRSWCAAPGRVLLRLGPRQAIDDARFARVPRADEIEQLRARALLFDDLVADVRPVEAGDENARVAELQARDDFAPRGFVGGRGERDARNTRMALGEQIELDVLRSEIVPPLRHAVRLVDGEKREPRALDQPQEARRRQALGRDVEQVEPAGEQIALDFCRRLRAERRV